MQHPMYSLMVAPLIYSMIRILIDSSDFYQSSDALGDRFRAAYFDTANTFDFIVVGAGSAGAIVANRLSLNNFTVLLLEAGGEMMPAQYIPSTSLLLVRNKEVDWSHLTVPQDKACQASVNKQSCWSAGKGLGGTSLINFLQYLRGHPKDFDNWANLTGDPSWNYENLLPHFKAIEDFKGEFGNEEFHGHGGEVTVQPPPFTGMAEYFVKAGEEKGYPRQDLNGYYTEGVSVIYNNIRNGRRVSTYNAFLEPIRNSSFLTIRKFSEVTKILFKGENNQAYGVEYLRHGVKNTAFSKNEVIISAGIVNSPKLIMLSGIGPKEHLESIGIEVKYDAQAVGKNLQDHLSVFLGPFFLNSSISMILDRDVTSESFSEYIRHGTGTLTSAGTVATALISSTIAKQAGEGDWPDLQYILVGTGVYSSYAKDFAKAFNIRKDVLTKYFNHAKLKDSFQIIVSGNRPFQKGEMFLKSKNPKDTPLIDPKYLHDERDMEVLLEGIKKAIDLVENSTVFRKVGAPFTDQVFPGCEQPEFRSDDYWRCYIREYTISEHHMVGSCSMGRANSKEAVVDPQLRVIGTENLRIIDASVMPSTPNGNTNAPSMMVGQKGASEILKTWISPEDNEVKDN